MNAFLWFRTSNLRRQVAAACIAALFISSVVFAQQQRPLTHADYDSWRSIQGQALSRDGKYLAYALVPQDGDGEVVVRHLESGKEWRASRGAAPVNPPQPNPGAEERYCSSPIFASMSSDHGLTWSTPEEISGVSPTICFFGNIFGYTVHFKQHRAGFNFSHVVIQGTLARAHSNFGRLAGNRSVWENSNPNFTTTFNVPGHSTASSFDLA